MTLVSQPLRIPLGRTSPFDIIDDDEPSSSFTERGRDPSPRRTALSLPLSPLFSPAEEAVRRQSIHTHHSLPPVTESIPDDPILYLPPLLSPLPSEHAHEGHQHHGHHHPAPAEIADFSTRLPHIDPASLVLHQALHDFSPIDTRYAMRRYDKAFNWKSLSLPVNVEREWYCVVFRSRRKPESSSLSLYQADREAHEEAVHNGGLVMYWYGVPDETGLNLATCIWQSRRHAIKAISGPKHVQAMKQAAGAYEIYELERWILRKEAGFTDISLRKWEGGEVGW